MSNKIDFEDTQIERCSEDCNSFLFNIHRVKGTDFYKIECPLCGEAYFVKMEKINPFIAFSAESLENCPPVKAGDEITCEHCGKKHILNPCDDGSEILLFYKCGKHTYLGAVGGKLVAGKYSKRKPDYRGEF